MILFVVLQAKACFIVLWYVISPQPEICTQHTFFTFKIMCGYMLFSIIKTSGLKG